MTESNQYDNILISTVFQSYGDINLLLIRLSHYVDVHIKRTLTDVNKC